MVAKWLGFKQPAFTGRSAIRGCATFKSSHGVDPKFNQYFGNGIRSGAIPCDDTNVYWYITWTPSSQGKLSHKFWGLFASMFPLGQKI